MKTHSFCGQDSNENLGETSKRIKLWKKEQTGMKIRTWNSRSASGRYIGIVGNWRKLKLVYLRIKDEKKAMGIVLMIHGYWLFWSGECAWI